MAIAFIIAATLAVSDYSCFLRLRAQAEFVFHVQDTYAKWGYPGFVESYAQCVMRIGRGSSAG